MNIGILFIMFINYLDDGEFNRDRGQRRENPGQIRLGPEPLISLILLTENEN